jgi:fatty-acyl-CoA synthase
MEIVADPVRTHALAKPGRIAMGDAETGRSWTWAEFDRAADRLAAWICAELGPASGNRVAVVARNHPVLLVVQFACARAGAIFVPLSWRLAEPELAAILADAAPALLFHDAAFAMPESITASYLLTEVELLGEPGASPPSAARCGWHDAMTLLYTSGTSGTPKGVIVTDANAFWSNINFNLGNGVNADSVFLCDMPLFHTAGLFTAARAPILAGAAVWISAGFDPAKTIARIADPDLAISHYFSVPQMAATLWQHPEFALEKFARLTVYATGGAPNPPAQIERFVRAGIPMSDGFGMTETMSNFAMPVSDPALLIAKAGSCGLPFLSVATRIVDDEGSTLADGETGELWIKGPSVSPGYWNRPELTERAFSDGWFKTGDIAWRDTDGFTYIVDRAKDMFISGGENVYPAEVEAVMTELPGVAQAAVIGVPDQRWGEVGKAFLVAAPGADLSSDEVTGHCLARLAKFKVPVAVEWVTALPVTGSGKVQKHLLRAMSVGGELSDE